MFKYIKMIVLLKGFYVIYKITHFVFKEFWDIKCLSFIKFKNLKVKEILRKMPQTMCCLRVTYS